MLMKTRKTLVPSMILRCCCLRSSKPSPLVSSASSKSHGLVTPRLTPPVMRLDLKRTAVSDFQPKPRSPHTPRSQDRLPDGSVHVCCAPRGSLQAQQRQAKQNTTISRNKRTSQAPQLCLEAVKQEGFCSYMARYLCTVLDTHGEHAASEAATGRRRLPGVHELFLYLIKTHTYEPPEVH